jgi:DNA-binding transcriptional ArsR family regulator
MTSALPEWLDQEIVRDGRRAALLVQHPLRSRILNIARAAPMSPSAIAAELGESRQKVNYHVRQLRRAGFLRPAGRRRKRGLVEQRVIASVGALAFERALWFASSEQRASFARELRDAIGQVIARHSSEGTTPTAEGEAGGYQLVVVCHPTVDNEAPVESGP